MKILLSEASSTSARQTLYALGPGKHAIDAVDPQRLCLGRFSRYLRKLHRCPPFARDPGGYLDCVCDLLARGRYDVLLPVHDQVFLLARFSESLSQLTSVALPPFESLRRLQSKVDFVRLMDELGLPQPKSTVLAGPEELAQTWEYPVFVKLVYSTAGQGVWHVKDDRELLEVVERICTLRLPVDGRQVLVQRPAAGKYGVTQAVFQRGELIAAHSYRARAAGVGGSAHARESMSHPIVREHVAKLGRRLAWHGALHIEYFFDEQTLEPTYIEANPRIGETMNATLSGLNLCELLLRISRDERLSPQPPSKTATLTHATISSLLAIGEQGGTRRDVLRELGDAWRGRGVYGGSQDELTRPREDARSLIPAAAVAGQLLLRPASAKRIVRGAVENYSLDDAAVQRVLQLPRGTPL